MDDDALMAFVGTLSESQQAAFADILEGVISELSIGADEGGAGDEVEGYAEATTTEINQQINQMINTLSSVLTSMYEARSASIRNMR